MSTRNTRVLLAARQDLLRDFGYTEEDIKARSYAVSDMQVKAAWDAAEQRMADIEQVGIALLATLFVAGREEEPPIYPPVCSPRAIEDWCRRSDVYYYTDSEWMVYPAPELAAAKE